MREPRVVGVRRRQMKPFRKLESLRQRRYPQDNRQGEKNEEKFIFTALALIAPLGIGATSHAQSAAAQKTMLQMEALGTSALTTPAPGVAVSDDFMLRQDHDTHRIDKMVSPSQVVGSLLSVPEPAGTSTTVSNPGFSGFNGLNHRAQRNAGTGIYANTQFSLEPPDLGLAVGNGFVLEAVNTALAVYDKNGTLLKGPTALNQFFNLAPEIKRTLPVRFGDFTSDPKCYFDRQTQRWFISLLQIDVDPVTGNFSGRSHILLAVSQTDDPTLGFNLFSIDATNDGLNGTPSHSGCPCFGDQPLIGADANGFYISTNEFRTLGRGSHGAQIYAMSKTRLAQGFLSTVVHFSGLTFPGGRAFSVQPATTPSTKESEHGEGKESERGEGVEFMMSTLNLSSALQNKIAVWAITGTNSLTEAVPELDLSKVVVDSEVYGVPPDAIQKAGSAASRPLGTLFGEPEELLATNDQRMQQVIFADGKLWGALTTVIKQGPDCTGFDPSLPTGFGPDCFVGIAWFQVKPSIHDDTLRAKLKNQGYVSVTGNFVFFPSVAVSEEGKGTISFSLSGPDFFPSVGYVRIDDGKTGEVHVAAAGAGPDDGFTGYAAFGGAGSGRWGDYSAGVADGEGNIWFAHDYISGGPRTLFANWATFIGHVRIDLDVFD